MSQTQFSQGNCQCTCSCASDNTKNCCEGVINDSHEQCCAPTKTSDLASAQRECTCDCQPSNPNKSQSPSTRCC